MFNLYDDVYREAMQTYDPEPEDVPTAYELWQDEHTGPEFVVTRDGEWTPCTDPGAFEEVF